MTNHLPACRFPKKIDVVLISTLRPELLDLTLRSFHKRFLSQFESTRIILNVDPIGESASNQDEIVKLVSRFTDEVYPRCPSTPSFARAVKWCWSKVESDFFIHLEDDWFLKRSVSFKEVEELLVGDPQLAGIRFNLSRNPNCHPLLSDGLSLNPSVFRNSAIQQLLPRFQLDKDPEKQFRGSALLEEFHFLYHGKPKESSLVVDTGKKWRKAHRFSKWTSNEKNITWETLSQRGQRTEVLYKCKYRFFLWLWRMMLKLPSAN